MRQQSVKTDQTFYEHVRELRKRVTWAALAFLIGGLLGYIYRQQALQFLSRPAHMPLYYNTPAGGFNLIMEVAAMCGLMVAIPILAYQLVRFLAPAWGDSIRAHHVFIITGIAAGLAALGAAFGYYVMLPLSLNFFGKFAISNVHPLISANSYLDFVVKCIIAFILIFQIPLIILFINKIKPIPPRKMLKWEKFVIVGALGLAVILPFTYDPISQFVMAVPIIFLYNVALVMIIWTNHWNKRKQRKADKRVTATAKPEPEPELEPELIPAASLDQAVDTPLAETSEEPTPAPSTPPVTEPAPTPPPVPAHAARRDYTSSSTRRVLDITLPRAHAKPAPRHLDLRNVLPTPPTSGQSLDLDLETPQQ